ncbi:MAG: Do family serine endopeptidase [Bdellovibrionota bacterium]
MRKMTTRRSDSTENQRIHLLFSTTKIFFGIFLILTSSVGIAYQLPSADSKSFIGNNSDIEVLQKMSKGVAAIAGSAKKALVFVSVSKTSKAAPLGMVDPFDFFFGPGGRRQEPQRKQEGLGSGFFVDLQKGYILTNNHVVEGADEITLKLANGKTYDGIVVGRDKNTDVAVVQVKDKSFKRDGLNELVIANSKKLSEGDFVIALGAPFGLEASISFGVVSALGRKNLHITQLGNFIQTDAAINPGNSGGPLIDMDGKVVGINTAIYSRSGGYAGIGFAVPSNLVREIAQRLINDGKIQRGYIGVALQPLDDSLASSLSLPKNTTGSLVTKVVKGAPADKAGIEPGDVIVKVDNVEIKEDSDLVNTIGLKQPGDKASLTYFRNGKKKTTNVSIGSWGNSEDDEQLSKGKQQKSNQFGLSIGDISQRDRQQYQIESKSGAVINSVDPDSPADKVGLRQGDVVVSVNGRQVKNANDLRKHLQGGKRLLLRVERQGEYFFVPLKK